MKYRSQWSTFILRSNVVSYWLIIPKYGVHLLNSLHDLRQNHWTMKHRSQWPTFILRSNVMLYWLIILKYDVYTSNSLQDKRQNHWTIKYRSQWPIFSFRSNIRSYWLIIPKYDVHASNSLQDIRQNHWTVKYRSWWPSLHDPQVKSQGWNRSPTRVPMVQIWMLSDEWLSRYELLKNLHIQLLTGTRTRTRTTGVTTIALLVLRTGELKRFITL